MLHPVAVFDGEREHRDRSTMPLVGGRDLRSPLAELRVAMRDLTAERANGAKLIASIARLEAELAGANSRASQLAVSRNEIDKASATERELWLQQKVALQAQKNALEGELMQTQQRLVAATDLRAQRDSQIAQLRAEIEDTRQQFELQRKTIAELGAENRDLATQLEESRRHAESLETQVSGAQTHAIEITHYMTPLIDELNQLRQSLAAERTRAIDAEGRVAALEARIAASLRARLLARWRHSSARRGLLFRAARRRTRPRNGVEN
jgi:chromosome segregation ATPase